MFQKLAAYLRTSDPDLRLLVPLLLNTALVQAVTAVIRITTSYRAIELNLSVVWLGVIAATFALFPIFIAVSVGRFIDRGHDAVTAWIGSAVLALSAVGFTFWSSAEGLMISTAVMGIGHVMLMTSQQMLCVRAASPRTRESVFGNYMVAGAIGQGAGPYIVGWAGGAATVPPTKLLFAIALVITLVSLAIALAMRSGGERPRQAADAMVVPVTSLLRVPGLVAVIAAGVILVSSSDLILIYVPLLGTERGIDVEDIGVLLMVRAAASMVARVFYARIVAAVGHWPLMIASTLFCAATFAVFAAPLPLWAMHLTVIGMGFSFGLATTLSITIVVAMTTAGARGTANSLRIMGNRLGQFVLPFGAGLLAAAAGLGGLFVILAAAIAASAAAMLWKRPGA
jgi:predicted MFS family arabinose efflux permease